MENNKYLSTIELAKMLGISRIAVYKKIQKGQIIAKKIGRNFAIDKKDLVKILEKELTRNQKLEIDKAITKTMKEYGKTLKLLGST
ncbi:MAG: helix-turn-helix domain-containing protein [Candidatus Parcubacteria bacterium]|nr:helix-turn-helix domain-containing protein [Candidatus Parcubacteria bacterium]